MSKQKIKVTSSNKKKTGTGVKVASNTKKRGQGARRKKKA